MLPILVPVPHATGAFGGSHLAEQAGRGRGWDWRSRGSFVGAGPGGERQGLFILGAMLFFFLFSLVFLSPLLNSQSDRGEDAAYEPTNYTVVASGASRKVKIFAFFS